jgi:transient receptor potential cation channel subfamily V member 6
MKIRKKRVDEEDPFGLTAALDQMAFAQDIVMIDTDLTGKSTVEMTSTTVVTTTAREEVTPATAASTTTMAPTMPPDYDTALVSTTPKPVSDTSVTQTQHPQVEPTPPSTAHSRLTTATTTPAKIPEKTFSDPLRDLILLSQVILIDDEEEFLRNVKSLAEDSSCLDYVLEVKSTDSYNQLQQRKQDLMKSTPLEQGMVLFQNPKEMVDPVKEAEFLKTLEALEDTDDSDAVEKPVLGKISLVRRAKSAAATRTSSDKRKNDENPLYSVAWEDVEASNDISAMAIYYSMGLNMNNEKVYFSFFLCHFPIFCFLM